MHSLTPLRHRGFRLLAGGQLASNVGDAFYAVALPWYVLANHGGAVLLGVVLAAYGVPRIVLLAVGGQASDRWRPWTVMLAADSVRAVAVAALGVVALAGPAHAALLIPIAVVLGAGEGLFLPGSMAVIPLLLPDEDLQAGNALSSGGTQLATLVGPAIGGGLVALAGPASAFLVDAGTFALSAATLIGILASQRRPAVATAVAGEKADVAAGVATDEADLAAGGDGAGADPGATPATLAHLLRSEPVLLVILGIVLAANLGTGGLFEVALPALAHGPFHAGADGYGGLVAAIGAGALVGTLVAGQVGRLRRPAIVASWAFLVEAAFMAAVPYLGSPVAAGGALAVFAALNGFGNVVTITVAQRWAPPEVLGRLMGVILVAAFGSYPISVAAAGLVVDRFGPAPFFPAAAILLALAISYGLTRRSWRQFGRVDDAEADPAPTKVAADV